MQPTSTPSPAAATTAAQPSTPLLDSIVQHQAEVGARYLPTLSISQFTEREKQLQQLKAMLVKDVDYGVIPGTDKPVLLKPGAEKICAFFGYVPLYTCERIEEWLPDKFGEPLFYYRYTCTLLRDGKPVGSGEGSCNSWESKYRYRWFPADVAEAMYTEEELDRMVQERREVTEFEFAIDKAETGGKYGRPASYWAEFRQAIENGQAIAVWKKTKTGKELKAWTIPTLMYRCPNPDFADVINTCQKIGQKRAHIAATLSATGASQYFTQDLEDAAAAGGEPHVMESPEDHQAPPPAGGTKAQADAMAQKRIAEEKAKAAAAAKEAEQVPAVIQTLWRNMGTKEDTICPVYAQLKAGYVELTGSEHGYYTILNKFGMNHANECRKVGLTKTRWCARELHETLERWQKQATADLAAKPAQTEVALLGEAKAAAATAEQPAELKNVPDMGTDITDDDIPTVLGGTFDPATAPGPTKVTAPGPTKVEEIRRRQATFTDDLPKAGGYPD